MIFPTHWTVRQFQGYTFCRLMHFDEAENRLFRIDIQVVAKIRLMSDVLCCMSIGTCIWEYR